jgi:hypothetical protein
VAVRPQFIARLGCLFSTGRSVSAKSLEHLAGWDAVRSALAEIHASHDELERFLSDEFVQLDSLGRELIARQERLEQSLHRRPDGNGAAPAETQRQIEELLAEARRQQVELRNMQATIQNQMTMMRDEGCAIKSEG